MIKVTINKNDNLATLKVISTKTSEFSLSTKFLDDILYEIRKGLTVRFNQDMPLNQYNSLVKQLDEREKYLKQQGIL